MFMSDIGAVKPPFGPLWYDKDGGQKVRRALEHPDAGQGPGAILPGRFLRPSLPAVEPPVQRPQRVIAATVILNEIAAAGAQRSQWPGA